MSETATLPDLSTLSGKRVKLTYTPKGESDTVTQEGRVELGSAIGLMFKEKGKSNTNIVEAGAISAVEELAPKEANVTRKTLQPVPLGRVRQHLADRHGWTLKDANALSEADAEAQHNAIDHEPLAHKHEVPAAVAQASASAPIADVSDVEGAEPEDDDEDDTDD